MHKRTTITRKWKKFMAVSCSHGIYQDDDAIAASIKFRKEYGPEQVIHLGDFCDTACLRAGAFGSKDEAVPLEQDFFKAQKYLYQLEPTLVFIGNHENRIYNLLNHHKAEKAYLANKCVEDLRSMVKAVKAEFIEHYDLFPRSWRMLGNTLFGHGVMFGQDALRKHVLTLRANICMGHLHRVAQESAHTAGALSGTCVGMLADVMKLSYAHHRPATHGWNTGWAYGEYTDNDTIIHLCQKTQSGEYRS